MRKLLWLLLLQPFCPSLHAQFRRDYVSDTLPKYNRLETVERFGDYVYTVGVAADSFGYDMQVIKKMDTLGQVVWGTPNLYEGPLDPYYYPRSLMESDGFLYVTGGRGTPSIDAGMLLTKIDEASGQILYNKSYEQFSTTINMVDYDATRLLGYSAGQFVRFNKTTGNLIGTTNVPGTESSLAAVAGVGIFYADVDTVFKRNYTNLNQVEWTTVVMPPTFQVNGFLRIVYDASENAVFAFGLDKIYKRPCVARINATTGVVDWTYKASIGSDYSPSQLLFDGDDIYIAGRHNYVGAGPFPHFITKLNAVTGLKDWEIYMEQDPNDGGKAQAARDMTLHNGFLYLSGYYSSDNYGPGKWGVLCFNAADGALVFNKQVPPIPSQANEKLSIGLGIFAMNNRIVVVGNSEIPDYETWEPGWKWTRAQAPSPAAWPSAGAVVSPRQPTACCNWPAVKSSACSSKAGAASSSNWTGRETSAGPRN